MKVDRTKTTITTTAILRGLGTVAIVLIGALAFSPKALALPPIGVYQASGRPDLINNYSSWLGQAPGHILDFVDTDVVNSTQWLAKTYNDAGYTDGWNFTFSLPILPDNYAVMRGDSDDAYRQAAQNLMNGGFGNSVIRIGWEMTLPKGTPGYPWAVDHGEEWAYVQAYRHIVDIFRSVGGKDFRFSWCVLQGQWNWDYDALYPGNDYVTYVGVDVYAAAWGINWPDSATVWDRTANANWMGLDSFASLASHFGKQLVLEEWGVGERWNGDQQYGPGDSPDVMKNMLDWIGSHDVAYANYWDRDNGDYNSAISNGERPNQGWTYKNYLNPSQ